MAMINLNGHIFVGSATSGWVFSDLTDWLSVSDAKGGLSARPLSHGSFDPGEWWRESVSPSFKANYLGESAVGTLGALTALRGVAASKTLVPMIVDLGDGPFTRMVRVHSIDIEDTKDSDTATVAIYLQAPDPLMYGAEVSGATGPPTPGVGISDPIIDPISEGEPGSPGTVELRNTGTASTPVKITVTGGLSEGVLVKVVETGEVLRLDRLIPDGSSIVFNSRTGRAQIDGQSDVTGFMTVDEWPQIPAHSTRTFLFTPLGTQTGSPRMTVAALPAHM